MHRSKSGSPALGSMESSIKQVFLHPTALASIKTINEQPELVPRRHNM
jgi:hypothetical protein